MQIAASIAARDRTPFIGRERERTLLLEDIERGTALLTLTGPSGIGKTRLARQVLNEVGDSYDQEGGAWFCNLTTCQSTAEVEVAVARMLGLSNKDGKELARAIGGRGRMLLVLDNLNRVAPRIGEVIGSWLDASADLQIIVTSIVPIGMEGEVRFELGPLEAADAVALYLERAHRAWAGRTFGRSEEPLVAELVGRLDRIPLAIELAAARVRVLPPQELLSRFGERFELLRSEAKGRQGSLLEALSLTWELLSARERVVLAQASVFEGGFTYEAAVAVLEDDRSGHDMLDLLDGLRSKALLQIEESEPPRFLLFESVRDYAGREFRRGSQRDETLCRHAVYFAEAGEREVAEIEGPRALAAIAWLKAERENLMAALSRNVETTPELAARAGLVLFNLLELEGHPPATLQILELSVEAARRSADPLLIARAFGNHAIAITPQGKVDEALEALETGLALVRGAGDRNEEGTLLNRLAMVLVRKGELERASALLEQAVVIGREEGLPLVEASALLNLGAAAHARLAVDEAERYYDQGITILRRHEYPRREGVGLTWLAGVWASQGRFREARRALHDALERCRQAGNRSFEANALMNLGGVDLAAGLLEDSERSSLQALALQREIGNLRGEGIVLSNLGAVALEQGDLELAESRLIEAVGILRKCGDRRFHAAALPFLAVMEARVGRPSEARRSLEEARAYFSEIGDQASLRVAGILEGTLELAEARRLASTRSDEAEALVARARARLDEVLAPEVARTGSMFEAIRLLEQDLEDWAAGSREVSAQGHAEGLRVGQDAAWFELAGKERVDLRRRVAIRRILDALVERRLDAPGVGLDPHELFKVGWPDVTIHPDAAMRRVYLGVWTLRDLGLSALLNQTDGYLLDPAVPVLRQRD